MKKYREAWPDYEIRNLIPGVILPNLTGELWYGQDLTGKTLFLGYEQRFGDVIQFARLLPRLKDCGGRVIVQVPKELARQIAYSFPFVEIADVKDPIPEYDYYQWITSLAVAFDMAHDQINEYPYQYFDVAEEDRVKELPMRPATQLKVGLLWAGKPDPDRSIPLQYYVPLLKHANVSFYSFQLGERRKELAANAVGWMVLDLAPKITDFYDSSAFLKEMDLLITIDTAIVHQAGALGVPTWLMLLYFSDWRWDRNRDDNDWYPNLRIFRQEIEGSWGEPARKLEVAFDKWVEEKTAGAKRKTKGRKSGGKL